MNKTYDKVIPGHVANHPELNQNEKMFYAELRGLCMEQGYCWASNSYLSELSGVTRRSVIRWLNKLKLNGLVYVVIIKDDNGQALERRIYVDQFALRRDFPNLLGELIIIDQEDPYDVEEDRPKGGSDRNVTEGDRNVTTLVTEMSPSRVESSQRIKEYKNNTIASQNETDDDWYLDLSNDLDSETPPSCAGPPLQSNGLDGAEQPRFDFRTGKAAKKSPSKPQRAKKPQSKPVNDSVLNIVCKICYNAADERARGLLTSKQIGQASDLIRTLEKAGEDLNLLNQFEAKWKKHWKSGTSQGNYQRPRPQQIQEHWNEFFAEVVPVRNTKQKGGDNFNSIEAYRRLKAQQE